MEEKENLSSFILTDQTGKGGGAGERELSTFRTSGREPFYERIINIYQKVKIIFSLQNKISGIWFQGEKHLYEIKIVAQTLLLHQ